MAQSGPITKDQASIAWKACATPREACQVLQRLDPVGIGQFPEDTFPAMGAPIALLQGLGLLQSQLMAPTRPLRIVMAGADTPEMLFDDRYQELLMARFGIPSADFHYVAPDMKATLGRLGVAALPGLAERCYPMLLAHYVRLADRMPDLVCIFHPVMSFNHGMWLQDAGLLQLVRAGVPVLCASHQQHEALVDMSLLGSAGYQTSALTKNLLAPALLGSPEGAYQEGYARSLFRIDGIDMESRARPTTALLAAELDRQEIESCKAALDDEVRADLAELAQVIKNGTYAQRQQAFARFVAIRSRDARSASYQRRWMNLLAGGAPGPDDAYASEYIRGALLLDRADWVLEYIELHPQAVHAQDGWGMTPLMFAAEFGDHGLIRELISRGANVDALSDYGYSALELALMRGEEAAALHLLEFNARIDHRGQTIGAASALAQSPCPMPRVKKAIGL